MSGNWMFPVTECLLESLENLSLDSILLFRTDKPAAAAKASDWCQLMDTFQASLDATDSAARNNRLDTDDDYWLEPESKLFERERSPEYSRERRAEPETPEESVWMILARQASLDPKYSSSKPVEKSRAAVAQNPEVLKPGNYLLVSWDALFWVEEETQETHICQISASVPQGDDFRYSFMLIL